MKTAAVVALLLLLLGGLDVCSPILSDILNRQKWRNRGQRYLDENVSRLQFSRWKSHAAQMSYRIFTPGTVWTWGPCLSAWLDTWPLFWIMSNVTHLAVPLCCFLEFASTYAMFSQQTCLLISFCFLFYSTLSFPRYCFLQLMQTRLEV